MHPNPSVFFQSCVTLLKQSEQEIPEFIGWELIETTRNSIQHLYQNNNGKLSAHQKRTVEAISYHLEVFTNNGKTMGTGSLNIQVFHDIKDRINIVIEMAKNSHNPSWNLLKPPAEPYPKVITADLEIVTNVNSVLNKLEGEIEDAISESKNVIVNSAELFLNSESIQRHTNTGIKTYKVGSNVYFEIAMEPDQENNTQEVLNIKTSLSANDLNLKDFILKTTQETLTLGHTSEPKTSEDVNILVNEDVIADLCLAVKSQLSCVREYHRLPCLQAGQQIYDLKNRKKGSSPLNITLDPFLPAMTDSSAYTGEGLVAKKAQIINDGKVMFQLINNRFGQYLKKEPNGITGNMLVDTDAYSYDELKTKEENVIEIIKFSSLLVDSQKMTWSSEIKLAKQYHSDGTYTMIKGGVMSGNIWDNFADAMFSSNTGIVNFPPNSYNDAKGYVGPAWMLIRKGVSVVGV